MPEYVSLKSVPPTATLYGVEAKALTLMPSIASVALLVALLSHVLLQLRRSPEQESALQRYLDEVQDSTSPNFHKWLTPEQFGQDFGVAKPVGNCAPIILRGRFGTCIAPESGQIPFVNALGDEVTRTWCRTDRLRPSKLDAKCEHLNGNRE